MNFVVHWNATALAELANIWLNSTDRDAIRVANNQIEQELAAHAATCGEPRSATEFGYAIRPLWIFYSVDMKTRSVIVRHVRELPDAA